MLQNANNYDVTFCFPEVPFTIDTVVETKVEPLWECHEQHFVGLFRIVVRLTFSQQQVEVAQKGDVISIDAIDVEGERGYFEYALPFEGEGDLAQIVVPQVKASIEKEHRLKLSWRAKFDLKQEELQQEVVDLQQKELKKEVVDLKKEVIDLKQQIVEEIESPLQTTVPVQKKQSNIFMNDLVEQFSIWRSSDLSPQKESNNNKQQQ